MNWRDLPPLAALRAFAAFADTGNVTAAGAALNVSHAAISQQMRSLERHMGLALLDRSGRALQLTDAGRQLAEALSQGFGGITRTVADLTGADADRPVHISTTPTFAARWLMPRLPEFRNACPQVDLMINPTPDVVQLEPGGIDVAVRYGTGDWPDHEAQMLLSSPMVVVAHPSLVQGHTVRTPVDLLHLPWLEEFGTTETTRWLGLHGVSERATAGRMQLPGNLLLDAVRDGQGVAVTVKHFVQNDLAAGRLVVLFQEPRNKDYYIVTRAGVQRPALRHFVTWLARQKEVCK